jgi:UDP-GlcNAc:undecaprenyl-phosphate GlcNAc-1-phosphate transferase
MDSFVSAGLFAFLASFSLGACITWGIVRLALSLPWLARPSSNRLHIAPTPVWGGVAIFLAFLLAAFISGVFHTREAAEAAAFASGIFILGLIDDIWKLRPNWKLFGQVLCAVPPLFLVFRHSLTGSRLIDVPLALLWIVGITNAFNLLDNINGLSAGTAVLVSGFQAVIFLHQGQPALALGCIALDGALLGFLVFNFPSGRIFMGDSGSLFVGFLLAVTTLIGAEFPAKNHSVSLLFPLLVMVVPVCDTTLVTLTRILKGRPISMGGTDHLSHRLIAYGLSAKSTVLALWALTFLSGIVAILTVSFGFPRLISIAALLLIAITLFGTYLTRFELHAQSMSSRQAQVCPRLPSWISGSLIVLFDFVLITTAYYIAYLLRFDGAISQDDMHLFISTIVELTLIKLAVFFVFGAYRPWWDYFGLRDAYRFGSASTLSSLIAVTYFSIIYRFAGFSRVVFVLDFLVFTLLAFAFRFSFRLFDDLAPANHRKRALIYGADSSGETALQLVSKHFRFRVVGFLDDDHGKVGYSIHSVPVRGCARDLERIVREWGVQVVLIAGSATEDTKTKLRNLCRDSGIALMGLRMTLEDLQPVQADDRRSRERAVTQASSPEVIQETAPKALSKAGPA